MGSNGSDQVMVSGCLEPDCSNATVEIKIKTLDSQTYTLQVDKCVPVPALKEQIASVTGVVSEQQRLICRGRVLKDDQLLSAYHVEDGHTLHLVVRQPIPPSSESLPDHPVTDPASSAGRSEGSRVSPSVVVETFNISEQGNGVTVFPGIGQIVSAVLNSFGTTNTGSGSEGVDLREPPLERLSRISNLIDLSNSSRRQPDQATARNQSNPLNVDSSRLQTATPLEPQQPPVIHDSLTTLSQYLSHLRHDFGANGGNSNSSEAAVAHGSNVQESDAASRVAAGQRGLPGPASLAEVMLSTRQLLIEQAADCLSHLARQLEDQANVTEPSTRMGFQTNALRSGALLQNLGASLLELGRTTMTLRLGQTPADAVVSAGPAVFISTSGPNPLMVQPLPFQLGTSFGAIPTSEPASGLSGGTLGSGFLPRNIDIRIRTGSLMPSVIVNQGEQNGAQPSLGQANSAVSGGENSIFQAAAGALGGPSSITESEVLVVPIRTVVAAVPAVRHTPSDTSHSSAGLLFPVLARVQRVTSGNMNSTRGSQSSSEHNPTGLDAAQQPITEAAGQHQNIGILGRDDNNHSSLGNQNGQGFLTELRSRLDQLFRNMFSVEEIHGGGDVNFQNTATNSGALHTGTTEVAVDMQEGGPRVGDEAADTQGEEPGVDDEGAFFSNLLRQTMPFISQNRAMDSNSTSSGENTDNTQGEEPGVDDEGAFFSNLLRQTMPFISQNRAMDSNSMSSGGNTDNRQESSTHAPNPDVGTSSRQADPPSPPRAKRQKRE